ncbi:acyl carrier protein [Terriglobus albidus]|uniref:acyl carrier protein n=1 Tax=Terriglobus albidus TaxID=1592106 RepID=UPI001FE2BE20|nr:acyl carrier protein [Terriglobus albidus]
MEMETIQQLEKIRQHCIELIAAAKKVPPETLSPASTFEEIGLDSLDKVTLAFDVEEAYDIAIPESALATIQSISDMAAAIQQAVAAKPVTTDSQTSPA